MSPDSDPIAGYFLMAAMRKPNIALSYGVHPVGLDGDTTGLADKAVRWLVTAGIVERDESVIWVEDESPDDRLEGLSMG